MDSILVNHGANTNTVLAGNIEALVDGAVDTPYTIKAIQSGDEELVDFLFSLGCYEGETVTIISVLADNLVINVKDARYSIDRELASVIMI